MNRSANDAIISEVQIAAPPERVFQALTDPKQLILWFTDASCPARLWTMDARLGGQYCFSTEKGTAVVNSVSEFECHGEILEFDPPQLLVYTWIANWYNDKSLRTIVRWELAPEADDTRVRITHSGLAEDSAARTDYSVGWPGVLQQVKKFVEKLQV